MSEPIVVDGIPFPAVAGPDGLTIGFPDAAFAAVAELVNQASRGAFGFREVSEHLRADGSAGLPAGSAVHTVPAAHVPTDAADAWRTLSGRPLEDPVAHIFMDHGYEVPAQSWVPLSFLLALVDETRHARLDREPAWLFRLPALFWRPAPGEFAVVDALEQRTRLAPLAQWDSMLRDFRRVGLFEVDFARERRDTLKEWNALRLLDVQNAAAALLDYVYSPEHRAVATPPPFPAAIEESPVALAVFASPSTPWPAANRHLWLAEIERAVDQGKPPGDYVIGTGRRGGTPYIESIARA